VIANQFADYQSKAIKAKKCTNINDGYKTDAKTFLVIYKDLNCALVFVWLPAGVGRLVEF